MRGKKEIREEIRQKLQNQDPKQALEKSQRIHEALYRLPEFKNSRCLLIYLSRKEEVETHSVVQRCLSQGKRVVVPKVNDKTRELELREIKNLQSDVEAGSWDIPEPVSEKTASVHSNEVDCMVLPGLVFDKEGRRWGRGKGYFDRLLAQTPEQIPRIGLAFSFQVMDRIPAEDHDQPVHKVLSS